MNTRIEQNSGIPRGIEILLSLAGMIALSPLLLACSIAVKFSSAGPILFRQLRVGRAGNVFVLFKFRSMVMTKNGLLITAGNDCRVTAVGKFLRKTKLDELPELFNVLKGDMSFVGPRPEVEEFVDYSNPIWRKVLSVRPGITDPGTLSLLNEEEILAAVSDKVAFYREVVQPFKLKGSLSYIEKKCWKNDFRVIFQTLRMIIFKGSVPKSNPTNTQFAPTEQFAHNSD